MQFASRLIWGFSGDFVWGYAIQRYEYMPNFKKQDIAYVNDLFQTVCGGGWVGNPCVHGPLHPCA